jgi:hypothetical protein
VAEVIESPAVHGLSALRLMPWLGDLRIVRLHRHDDALISVQLSWILSHGLLTVKVRELLLTGGPIIMSPTRNAISGSSENE